ncbi:HpaII family restriction endonuclease [bacterium]|nr:HpaII family restriction endonuclease [bacterium]MBQ9149524.1 HpaII family restriction endonuclease [bacterium]
MIAQNKGEWSELYVFLKLLGDGVLYAADADLNKIENLYYPLIEISRKENKQVKHYIKNGVKIKIKDDANNVLLELPASEFTTKAKLLLNTIKESNGTFSAPAIEDFIQIIKCSKVKADSTNKSDITLVLHDCKTYRNETFDFSIKSKLGSPSTLLNSGKPTNFIYEICGNLSQEEITKINQIDTKAKLRDRLSSIKNKGCHLIFAGLENKNFEANLQMIDSAFPLIISEYLIQYYSGNGNLISELTPKVRTINPCNLNINLPHLYYKHKIKNFLTDIALGMTPATVWNGEYQATGGYIIVREDGEILCYHLYNHKDFQEYLFKNTRFDTPSATRYEFGYIYKENEKLYIKLNLQIRFI